jgi:hypothetical protein
MNTSIILLVFAFVLFVIATFPAPVEPYRFRLVAAGLAFMVAAQLFGVGALG